jgi:hypothetical protein
MKNREHSTMNNKCYYQYTDYSVCSSIYQKSIFCKYVERIVGFKTLQTP